MEVGLQSKLATFQNFIEQALTRIHDSMDELDAFQKSFEHALGVKVEEQKALLKSFNDGLVGLKGSVDDGLAEDRRIRRKLEADFTNVVDPDDPPAEGGPTTKPHLTFQLEVAPSLSPSAVVFSVEHVTPDPPDVSIPWDEVIVEVHHVDGALLFGPEALGAMVETGTANLNGPTKIEGIFEIQDAPSVTIGAKYNGQDVNGSPQSVTLKGLSPVQGNGVETPSDATSDEHKGCPENGYLPGSSDGRCHSSGGDMVLTNNGTVKLDGLIQEKSNGIINLSLASPSLANREPPQSSVKERSRQDVPANGLFEPDHPQGPTWDDTNYTLLCEGVPDFSLLDPGVRMVLVHDFPFDYNDAKEIPQMVTKDHHLDRTYICDLGISQIHTYEGWNYKGYWQTSERLISPRNVMIMPNVSNPDKGRKKGLDVVVLDSNGIHVFDSSGKKRRTFYEGKGSLFRGLAYNQQFGWVITCQVSGPVPEICLLDVHDPFDSEFHDSTLRENNHYQPPCEKIRHSLICDMPGDQNVKTACKFLATYKNMVYTSDIEGARFYETNLSTGKTRACQVPGAKLVTGIATDPSGIILVGSMSKFRSDVFLFDQNLNYVKTLELEVNLSSISSITFHGKDLFITDVKESVVHYFIVSTGSPKKIREQSDRMLEALKEII